MPCMSSQPSTISEFAELTGKAADPAAFAIVALGANLVSAHGNPHDTVQAALGELARRSSLPMVVSPLLVTEPVDCPPGSPDFVNAVVALYLPGESPGALLQWLQGIEQRFGRRRSGLVNEARTLDLDLIAAGPHQLETAHLTLPHPRAHLRRFVLAPLAAIWPDFRLPGQSLTVTEQLHVLDQQSAGV